MTIYNLGSINRDLIYNVETLPLAGETLAAQSLFETLGGKGLNQSVAAIRAGADVVHLGAVGLSDSQIWTELRGLGLATDQISQVDHPTGHAIINVDEGGENAIVLFQGANVHQCQADLDLVIEQISETDFLLLQNETNLQTYVARKVQAKNAEIIYSAAPFDAHAVAEIIEYVSILVMNEVEALQLQSLLKKDLKELPVKFVIVTKGADGAECLNVETGEVIYCASFPANAIDTTGAGDTFIGYVAAGLSDGQSLEVSMRFGSAAAALMVSRQGTAAVIPIKSEVDTLL